MKRSHELPLASVVRTPRVLPLLGIALATAIAACGQHAPEGGAGSSTGGGTSGTSTGDTPVVAAPGQLALAVGEARQHVSHGQPDLLEIVLTLANGEGGGPVPLNPLLFQVKTADGILYAGQPLGGGYGESAWVDGSACDPTVQIGGGASLTCGLQFDLKQSTHPVEIVYSAPGVSTGLGDLRTASAAVNVEPCVPCGSDCTYLDRDFANCGACGTTPPGGVTHAVGYDGTPLRCVNGEIVCDGPTPLTYCAASGPACADLQTDLNNCGACGVAASYPSDCVDGHVACASGYTACAGGCVNLQTDPNNCGACGQVVTPDAHGHTRFCAQGKLVCAASSYTLCGDVCVNLQTDPENCGGCGNAVEPGASCESGKPYCSGTDCGPKLGCVNTSIDTKNCGGCGIKCNPGQYCIGACF